MVFFKKQAVSGKEIYRLEAMAERPTGRHALMAVYSEKSDIGSKSLPVVPGKTHAKGLRPIQPEDEPPYAVRLFEIVP